MTDLEEKNKDSLRYALIFTIAFFIVNLFFVFIHEPWRDEAQAWVIVKNLSLVDLFKVLRVEGHPILWFLVIYPFAKLGFSFYYFSYFSLFLTTIAVFLFLLKSPFPKIINILVCFGSSFFYYNSAIPRVYSLISLITVLICLTYKDRFEHPFYYCFLLGLLIQTHVKICGIAIGLMIDFYYDAFRSKNRKEKYILISLLSLLMLIPELLPYGPYRSSVPLNAGNMFSDFFEKLLKGYYAVFESSFDFSNSWIINLVFLLFMVCVISLIVLIIKEKKFAECFTKILTAVFGIGAYFFITAFVYRSLHHQMATILANIFLIICCLFELTEIKMVRYISRLVLVSFCLLSLPVNISEARNDIDHVYSYGKETADFIENKLEENSVVLLTYDYQNPLVYALVKSNRDDIRFFDVDNNELYRFHQWNVVFKEKTDEEIVKFAKEMFTNDEVYYLSSKKHENEKLINAYDNDNQYSIVNENYYLYKINK